MIVYFLMAAFAYKITVIRQERLRLHRIATPEDESDKPDN